MMLLVEWYDITAQLNTTESPKLADAVTLGFLEEKNDKCISLSTTIFMDDYPGGYSDRITIPLGCIKNITKLIKEGDNNLKTFNVDNSGEDSSPL
tara:strand:+ start:4978 stop:5262 length:285 start_codon:yes stop_codon:yes gene_type:complete